MTRVTMFATLGLALVVAPRLAFGDPTAAIKDAVQQKVKAKAQEKAKAKAQEKVQGKTQNSQANPDAHGQEPIEYEGHH